MDTFIHTPLLQKTECVIIGATIAAFSAALHTAACGQAVTIVSEETFLYSDLVKASLYHLPKDNKEQSPLYSILFPAEIDAGEATCEDSRIIHPDTLKLRAERLCEQEGIALFYKTVILHIEQLDGKKMVRIAGKFGIGTIQCTSVLDLRKHSCYSLPNKPNVPHTCGFLMHVMDAPFLQATQVHEIMLADNKIYSIILRPGAYGKGHATMEIQTSQPYDSSLWKKEPAYKALILKAFKWVKIHLIGFENITPGRFAESPYRGTLDIEAAIEQGFLAAKSAIHGNVLETEQRKHTTNLQEIILSRELTCYSHNPIFDYTSYLECKYQAGTIPVDTVLCADIVVVGGGTAGIMAAIAAAKCNQNVIIVEGSHQLGGTATIGGVSAYWYGRRFPDVQEVDSMIHTLYEELRLARKKGIWTDFDQCDPALRSYILARLCTELSITVIHNCMAFAGLKKGNTVSGVVATDGDSTMVLLGECIIDATGDADIAVFSGAAHTYGGQRDVVTFWASLAQYTSPNEYSNNFASTVMVGDPFDYTRFIKEGRQRGTDMFDHGTYLAPRETRHIIGLKTITLREILAFEEYPDNLYTCFSNYDPKGKSSADIIYAGFLPPPMPMAVPLSALLPVDINKERIQGLIVIGKAISVTHDAFPGLRMQTDLMHQGTVVGMAAARVVQEHVDFPYIDMESLQIAITKETGDPLSLAAWSMDNPGKIVEALDATTKKEWTNLPFTEEINATPIAIAAALMNSTTIRALLENRFSQEQDNGIKLLIAHLLLWHHSDYATDFVMHEIERELAHTKSNTLPERKGSLQCVQMLPDHGVMAEMIYSLNLLAWSKKDTIIPIFNEICRRLRHGERDYCSNAKSIFHYIESIAYVAERTVLPEFKSMLKNLIALPEFILARDDLNLRKDLMQERLVILLLSLYRALARLGDIEGYEGLVSLLSYKALSIRISACMEIQSLTKIDLPIVQNEWDRKIHQSSFISVPTPIKERIW